MSPRARSTDVRRAELPGKLPRASKRSARRADAHRPPANIRTSGLRLSRDERSYIRRKVGLKLGKFSPAIERVTVRLGDMNGPRGGVDKICATKVVVSGLPSVVVERTEHDLRAAIDGTLDAVERAVRKAIQRRRSARPRAPSAKRAAARRRDRGPR
jgi:ribosome-associated translation inhibitor RaiA